MKLTIQCAGLALILVICGCTNQISKATSDLRLTQAFDVLTFSTSGGMTQNFVDLQIRSDGSAIEIKFDPRFGYKVRTGRLSRAAVVALEPEVQAMLKAHQEAKFSSGCSAAIPDAASSSIKVMKDSQEHIWTITTCSADANRWNALANAIGKVSEPVLKPVP